MTIRRTALACSLLSLAGLGLAGYLSFLHLALLRGELIGGPLCGGIGSLFNCHAVAASRFSSFLGVPVPFWGVLGYLMLLTLSFIALQFPELNRQALTAVAALAGAFLVLDLGLLWVMVFEIRVLCTLCLLMYGIKVLILWTAKRGMGRRWTQLFKPMPSFWLPFLSPAASAAGWMLGMVAVTGLAGILAVHFSAQYLSRSPEGLRARIIERMQTAPRVTVEAGDSPRLGSLNAPVQVVVFTDFLCPLCREAAQFNAIAWTAHRRDISLVVKQFPLDLACNSTIGRTVHPGACRVAEAAACAHEQGKFWAFHDRLFREGPPGDEKELEALAARVGLDLQAFSACRAAGRGRLRLARDVEEGRLLGVTATPTFFINGIKVLGAVTPVQFDDLVAELRDNNASSKEKMKK